MAQNNATGKRGRVISVSVSPTHSFSKASVPSITVIPGLGVKGDAHFGATVQHLSRLHIKPPPANLRQVHLMPTEILAEVSRAAIGTTSISASQDSSSGPTTCPSTSGATFNINPGDLGENVTTTGLNLRNLSKGTRLIFVAPCEDRKHQENDGQRDKVAPAVVQIQGLRNPCHQIDKFQPGLKEKFIIRNGNRSIIGRLAGVMATVETGGEIRPGMEIVVAEPTTYMPLECV